jgi:hypothetical protein
MEVVNAEPVNRCNKALILRLQMQVNSSPVYIYNDYIQLLVTCLKENI